MTAPAPPDLHRRRTDYDALLVLSFGGPERREDVLPFLRGVVRGRPVPEDRLLQVAEHYYQFGGASPINDQNRALIAAVETELAAAGLDLPVYWGNRNWTPYVADTVATMAADGVRRALVFATSTFGSYSGCRRYLEDLEAARRSLGADAPVLDKLRLSYNHPGFIAAVADGLAATVAAAGDDPVVLFSAHSIPESMAAGAPYVEQLREAAGLVSEAVGITGWELVFQSRSGPPTQPWLGPDVAERVRQLPGRTVVVCPIGFVSDHMEVGYDLDVEAASVAAAAGVRLLRAPTVGTHPRFVRAIRELVEERLELTPGVQALGPQGPWPDFCPAGCCPPGGPPGGLTRPGA